MMVLSHVSFQLDDGRIPFVDMYSEDFVVIERFVIGSNMISGTMDSSTLRNLRSSRVLQLAF